MRFTDIEFRQRQHSRALSSVMHCIKTPLKRAGGAGRALRA